VAIGIAGIDGHETRRGFVRATGVLIERSKLMSQFKQTTARIAAWNLAGFGGIPTDRLKHQAEGLALLDAEVVALVEINPISALDTIIAELEQKGVTYKSAIVPQSSDLHIGVLYKEGVEATNPRLLNGSDLGDPSRRKAFMVNMKVGKFDFILMAVHLKSGRGGQDQQIRDEQAKVIGDFITQFRATSREDLLLVGDFNMIPGQDVSNFHHLGGDDLMDFLSSWDLQDRYSHILEKGRANLLDGFAVSRTYSTEYIRGSLRLFPMHWCMDMGRDKFRETVSDHLPFVASFRIDRDRV
jgi:exonuclease III